MKRIAIEVRSQPLDDQERLGAGGDDQAVGPAIGNDHRPLELGGLRLGPSQPLQTRVHQLLDQRRHPSGGGV